MPAYWWLYNMYALARNSWKFHDRDKRVRKIQKLEFDPLAPDTVEEIFTARRLLEIWTAKAVLRQKGGKKKTITDNELAKLGRDLLKSNEEQDDDPEILGERMENAKRKVVILKNRKAYHAYGDMLHYYAVKNLVAFLSSEQKATFSSMCVSLKGKRQKEWVNLGGQIMKQSDVDKIRANIGTGKLGSWQDIHDRYDVLWDKYPIDKQRHAFATLCDLSGKINLTKKDWLTALDKAVKIQQYISDQVYISRKKDFDNPYRHTTFRNMDEMKAASGNVDENSFIIQVRKETADFEKLVKEIKKRKR
jgi:hypothetical protein